LADKRPDIVRSWRGVASHGAIFENWAAPLVVAPRAEQPQFEVGQEIDVARAVWNGSENERDGIKSVSQFVRFSITSSSAPAPVAFD
jgi:hypothetical protein